ncbi:PP2C family protein-serine/threonine phosphatase [Kitasatospora sp. MBT63]|uniref:PP2C family protein-serine/threonine phosphatase n=1 Tax=Kitasatospora sp. MBT63 TaxID=1444768 RepID=UPI0011EA676B|nr:PP2C family protein-serine/threonine phosphatase [Kitasatospora sp. MBT63]
MQISSPQLDGPKSVPVEAIGRPGQTHGLHRGPRKPRRSQRSNRGSSGSGQHRRKTAWDRIPDLPRSLGRLAATEQAWLAPIGVLAVVCAVTLALSAPVHLAVLTAAAPVVAAVLCSVRVTLVVSALTLVTGTAVTCADGSWSDSQGPVTITALLAVSLAALWARRERDRSFKRALTRTSLANESSTQVGRLGISGWYLGTTKSQSLIGGDVYIAVNTGHGARILMGDVRGKGLTGIDSAARMLAEFLASAYEAPSLSHLAQRLETALVQHVQQSQKGNPDEVFVTGMLVEAPLDEPVLRIVNCGHPEPFIIHEGASEPVETLSTSLPFGLGGLSANEYVVDTIPFETGDTLVLYTDGVTECRGDGGDFYPLADRLGNWTDLGPRELARALRVDLLSYSPQDLDDDAAILVAQRVKQEDFPGMRSVSADGLGPMPT